MLQCHNMVIFAFRVVLLSSVIVRHVVLLCQSEDSGTTRQDMSLYCRVVPLPCVVIVVFVVIVSQSVSRPSKVNIEGQIIQIVKGDIIVSPSSVQVV